jgi:hypothetical protein
MCDFNIGIVVVGEKVKLFIELSYLICHRLYHPQDCVLFPVIPARREKGTYGYKTSLLL